LPSSVPAAYNDQTASLVGFYKEEGLLLSVDATSSETTNTYM
jgi:adenylate kinase family enzyme